MNDENGDRFERVFRGDILRSWATDEPLDPRKAISIALRELWEELADRIWDNDQDCDADELVYVPRIPINVAEARAMLTLFNIGNGDDRWYAGYTNEELELVGGAGIQIEVYHSDPRKK